jgi:Skp family chaperone for outer membrane proteins
LLAVTALCAAALVHQALAQPAGPAPAATRIATCNVVQLFREYNKAKTITVELEQQKQQIEQAQRDAAQTIQRREALLNDQYRRGTDSYEQEWEKIQLMKMDAQRDYNLAMGKAVRKYQRATLEVYQDITRAVGTVAKAKGYDIVLYQDPETIQPGTPQEMLSQIQQKKILYSPDNADITAEVLVQLDRRYDLEQNR